MTTNRRLAAIMVADVVGYSRMMEADELGTLTALKERRSGVLEPVIKAHGGRVVKLMGDGVLVEFGSAVNAVNGAIELQKKMTESNDGVAENRQVVLRIGINLGDVIGEGSDIYGEGVNIAARLEPLAEPGGIIISEKVHAEIGSKCQVEFADAGVHQLKNIGSPIRAYRSVDKSSANPSVKRSPGKRPSVAVLPFDNMSEDAGQQYFSDGITEDIITELSRFRSLFVIARNSSFAFRGENLGIPEIGRRLGVDYVVEGSVRRSGQRARITAQLIEAATGNHIWAERYDRGVEDIFSVQEDVARLVATTLLNRVELHMLARSARRPPDNFAAYDYLLKGITYHQTFTPEDNSKAEELIRKAVELDPDYGEAIGWLAFVHLTRWGMYLTPQDLEEAVRLALVAVSKDPNNARCQLALGVMLLYKRDFVRATAQHELAHKLNPNDPHILAHMALLLAVTGRASEAHSWFERAKQYNPFPPTWYAQNLAVACYVEGRYEEVLRHSSSSDYISGIYSVAALAQLGRLDEARKAASEVPMYSPKASLLDYAESEPFLRNEDLDHLIEGLRKASSLDRKTLDRHR